MTAIRAIRPYRQEGLFSAEVRDQRSEISLRPGGPTARREVRGQRRHPEARLVGGLIDPACVPPPSCLGGEMAMRAETNRLGRWAPAASSPVPAASRNDLAPRNFQLLACHHRPLGLTWAMAFLLP